MGVFRAVCRLFQHEDDFSATQPDRPQLAGGIFLFGAQSQPQDVLIKKLLLAQIGNVDGNVMQLQSRAIFCCRHGLKDDSKRQFCKVSRMHYPQVIMKKGREKPVLQRHPWIFSGAIEKSPNVTPGSIVDVVSRDERFLGRGYYNGNSQIRVRLLTWDAKQAIDADFWQEKITASCQRRAELCRTNKTNASRLIFGESDLLPGLIVDQYDNCLVMQALTAGIDHQRDLIIDILKKTLQPAGILERSDDAVRKLEGMPEIVKVHHGSIPERLTIQENGHNYHVTLETGQKTGFYLDQRDNRQRLAQQGDELFRGKKVLNCFCYTGSFSVLAAAHGAATIHNVDSSAAALALAKENMQLNGFAERPNDVDHQDDAFEIIRKLRAEIKNPDDLFDIIILDPPKLVFNQQQIDTASRAYKDINMIAFQLLKPGGYLATFSCSGLVSADLFQKIIFSAALDSKTDAQIRSSFQQASDHPVLLTFPESAYLKGLLCQKL